MVTLSKNRELSESIAQKTFFKAMTAMDKRRGSSSEFTWLCAIAKNLWLDEVRSHSRTAELDEDLPSPHDVARSLESEETMFQIHRILHELEEPYKEVFQLRVFGELSFHKIGTLFQKTENWARVTYHRARLKIQERVEDSL